MRGLHTITHRPPGPDFPLWSRKYRHMMDFDYVPGVLRSFWGAPNHVPVQPVNSQNAQVHGLGHPPSSQMRQARALKPIERTFSGF